MALKMKKSPKIVSDSVDLDDETNVDVSPEEETVKVAVSPKAKQSGWVEVSMHEEISPAPVIGKFSFAIDMSITKLEKHKTYRVPKDVADVLVDRKKAIILPG